MAYLRKVKVCFEWDIKSKSTFKNEPTPNVDYNLDGVKQIKC